MLKSLFQKKAKIDKCTREMSVIPSHVAIIMDGNGRWATKRGMPRSMGHKKGAEVLLDIVSYAKKKGIRVLSVYAFSTENWKRPEEEVNLLMELMHTYLEKHVTAMHANDIQVRFLGDVAGLSPSLQKLIADSEELTKDNKGLTLQIAINYGGRLDITQATKQIAKDVLDGYITWDEITEELVSRYLYTKEYGEVDLLIRPSHDYRVSNFLLWQLAYAEMWFTDKNWPDFNADVMDEALQAFAKRERRFGGLKDEK